MLNDAQLEALIAAILLSNGRTNIQRAVNDASEILAYAKTGYPEIYGDGDEAEMAKISQSPDGVQKTT